MMSDYKFNIGDIVRVLKTDDWSSTGMEQDIGQFGTVVERSDDEGINGYRITNDKNFELWYMEDSLELVSNFNKEAVLNIIYEELLKDTSTETYKALLNIFNKIEKLPCK